MEGYRVMLNGAAGSVLTVIKYNSQEYFNNIVKNLFPEIKFNRILSIVYMEDQKCLGTTRGKKGLVRL
ncbi:hypothetical protein C1645_780586 [Glomus cerebriforme]|uniref:Uncharacterized protein n=1 Tax=Glomus cerebriforme TaxID=658196 RepID=A0A397SN35_9GLOM|nr:hypothetical protein C1645_780586 [Glomus cerebriforme]